MRKLNILVLIIFPLFALISCNGTSPEGDIKQYIQKIKSLIKSETTKKGKPDESTEKKKTKLLRSNLNPFLPGSKTTKSEGKGSFLSSFSPGGLQLIGIMSENNKKWAIIKSTDDKIFVVTTGSEIANTKARVKSISNDAVKIEIPVGEETQVLTLKLGAKE